MKKRLTLEERKQRLLESVENVARADENLWRYPLAEAVMKLLREEMSISFDSLIAELRKPFPGAKIGLTEGASAAAIERLQKLRANVGDDPGE